MVSILVLSGFGLWSTHTFSPSGEDICFNPCSIWIRSVIYSFHRGQCRHQEFQSLFYLDSVCDFCGHGINSDHQRFNPCSIWIRSVIEEGAGEEDEVIAFQSLFYLDSVCDKTKREFGRRMVKSFNPCSIWIRSVIPDPPPDRRFRGGFNPCSIWIRSVIHWLFGYHSPSIRVSILVLSGFGLWYRLRYTLLPSIHRFNPCSIWIRSVIEAIQYPRETFLQFQSLFYLDSVCDLLVFSQYCFNFLVSILVLSGFGLWFHGVSYNRVPIEGFQSLFYLDSVCDLLPVAHLWQCCGVSILVLSGFGLW